MAWPSPVRRTRQHEHLDVLERNEGSAGDGYHLNSRSNKPGVPPVLRPGHAGDDNERARRQRARAAQFPAPCRWDVGGASLEPDMGPYVRRQRRVGGRGEAAKGARVVLVARSGGGRRVRGGDGVPAELGAREQSRRWAVGGVEGV